MEGNQNHKDNRIAAKFCVSTIHSQTNVHSKIDLLGNFTGIR